MGIDRVNISNSGIDRSPGAKGPESAGNTGKGRQVSSGSDSDSVAVSSKAKEIGQLGSAVEQSRTEHLNKVRQALESGTYQVSAKNLAEKLIDSNQK